MAASFARVAGRPDYSETTTDMTCDASYPAGGYPVTPANLGMLDAPDTVYCYVKSAQGLLAMHDPTNAKIKLFVSGTTDSVLNEAGSNDVSTSVIVRLVCRGRPVI
jgi:hypothetical protein